MKFLIESEGDNMAVIRLDLFSTELHRNIQCKVIYPSISYLEKLRGITKLEAVQKVMILLPGFGERYDVWEQQLPLDDFARKHRMVFVMIDMYNAYAVKTVMGVDLKKYFFELIGQLKDLLKLPGDTDNYSVAGVSQGGINAVLTGLSDNEDSITFRNIASFSGCFGVQEYGDDNEFLLYNKDFLSFFGFDVLQNHDPILNTINSKGNMNSSIYLYCGEDDQYYLKNVEIADIMSALGYDIKMCFEKGYGHTWDYWKKCFTDFCRIIC